MPNKYTVALVFFLITILVVPSQLIAQKKVKGVPEAFKRPVDLFESSLEYERQLEKTDNKDKKIAWIVISDRDNNPVYTKASVSSGKVKDIQFRELFYVVDEKDDWIKIATASGVRKLKSKTIESIGWVPKDKMLLWRSGLVDSRTKINKKAFLLNRADDVKNVIKRRQGLKQLIVDFYRDPKAQKKEKERTIYDYYFVFKKEGDMYLLSEESELTAYSIESKLLGWVSKRRLQEWNTRICIEPNFELKPYEERKANKDLHFKAFGKVGDVKKYVQGSKAPGVFWDNDPVKFRSSEMAKADYKRFKGNVIRFPLFKKNNFGDTPFFRSGVIGSIKVLNDDNGKLTFASEIPENKHAQIKELVSGLDEKNNNVNVFFVIEGTDKTYAFQQDIVNAIQSVKNNELIKKAANVNYGALIYRDIPEGTRITEYEKLTPNLDKVTNFVAQSSFNNEVDQDAYTALFYGLKKSLKVAGFKENNINIIILLGTSGDYSVDKSRKSNARSSNHESLIEDKSVIFRELSNLDAYLYSIQLYNDGRRKTGIAYAIQSQKIILEAAKYAYNKSLNSSLTDKLLGKVGELQFVQPTMATPFNVIEANIEGSKPGGIILPAKKQSLNKDRLLSGLHKMIDEALQYEKTIRDVFAATYGNGQKLDVRKFSKDGGIQVPDLSSGIIKTLVAKMDESGIDDKIIVESTGIKLSLYTEVFLPLQIKGAQNPAYSYVLFMPETDLLEYKALIDRNISLISSGSYSEKRKALFEMYLALIEQFAGQKFMKDVDAKDMTRKQVMEIMQGIRGEGLELSIDLDIRIGDIRSEKKVSNEVIDQLIQRFNDVSTELERVKKISDRYDFCMVSDIGLRYYWLTLNQVF